MIERRRHSYSREQKLAGTPERPPGEPQPAASPVPIRPRPKDECAHRGELLRTAPCQSCSGEVQVKIRGCAVHGECTLSVKDVGVQRCRDCLAFQPVLEPALVPDRVPDPAPPLDRESP